MPQFLKITLFCLFAGIAYGVLHDQVTAHLCVEYFTVAHPPVFPTRSPFLLALGWGVIATWWLALPLGAGVGAAARLGSSAQLSLRDVRPVVLCLLGAMAISAMTAGVAAAVLAAHGETVVDPAWREQIPTSKLVAFSADAWAHSASYLVGLVGGVAAIIWTVARRILLARRGKGA